MKRKNLIIISALLCVLLSGCSAAEKGKENIEPGKSNSVDLIPGKASADNSNPLPETPRDSENVKFLYERPQAEQPAVGIYNCENAAVSEEIYFSLFSNIPECEKQSFPETKRRIDRYKTASESGTIDYTDDVLQGASYYTEQGMNYTMVEDGNDVIDTVTEFDFISRAELSEKIKSIVRGMFGIDVEVTIDAVTADRFAADAKAHAQADAELRGTVPNVEKYGAASDFYAVSLVQKIEGVTYDGSYGSAIYTAKGLESLYVGNPVRIVSTISTNTDFITLDGAEKLLKEKYELLLLDEPDSFTKAELTYVHSDNVLTPAWKFTSEYSMDTTFDAYTGKEIVWWVPGEKA